MRCFHCIFSFTRQYSSYTINSALFITFFIYFFHRSQNSSKRALQLPISRQTPTTFRRLRSQKNALLGSLKTTKCAGGLKKYWTKDSNGKDHGQKYRLLKFEYKEYDSAWRILKYEYKEYNTISLIPKH